METFASTDTLIAVIMRSMGKVEFIRPSVAGIGLHSVRIIDVMDWDISGFYG